MMVMYIEHWPDGDQTRRRPIGSARVTNTETGNEEVGEYAVELYGVPRSSDGTQRRIAEATFHAPRKGGQMSAFRVCATGVLQAVGTRA